MQRSYLKLSSSESSPTSSDADCNFAAVVSSKDQSGKLFTLPQKALTPGDTSSDPSFSNANQWIQECVSAHSRCGDGKPKLLPSRVLEIINTGSSTMPSVRLHERAHAQHEHYACLSHCWGQAPTITTTTLTLAERKLDIPWVSLPKTFQDAVTAVRRIGLSYLWIDALCIVQDDAADWRKEAADMASIYENAYLTIAATASSSTDGGCFYPSRSVYRAHAFNFALKSREEYQVYARRRLSHCEFWEITNIHNDADQWPLLTRAWTYQERLLSPRILHFTRDELWWECMEHNKCECSPDPAQRPRHVFTPLSPKMAHSLALQHSSDHRKLSQQWRYIVEEYSGLSLTFEKDKLYALEGVASQIRRSNYGVSGNYTHSPDSKSTLQWPDGGYLDGVWAQDLSRDLCWRTMPRTLEPRRANPNVPTWSWASIVGEAIYNYSEHATGYITLLGTEIVQPKPRDTTSPPARRYLKLLVPLAKAILEYSVDNTSHGLRPLNLNFHRAGDAPVIDAEKLLLWADYQFHQASEEHIAQGSLVYCIQVYSRPESPFFKNSGVIAGLVLVPYGPAAPLQNCYKRIGFFEYHCPNYRGRGARKEIWNKEKQVIYLL